MKGTLDLRIIDGGNKLGNVLTSWDRMVGMDNQGIGLASDISLLPGFGAQ